MKITVVAVGQRQPAWAQAAVDDYLARFPADFKVELKEVKAEPRSGKGNDPVQRLIGAEAARLRAAVPTDGRIVVLDERGADWTTDKLASALGRWRDEARDLAFVVGSADGLADSVKRAASAIVALSALTLPHGLVRVVLAEQLYRAVSLLAHHPYHRE